ncbi:MAG TPA: nucleoside triphosphate pyrophosphohydrolase [Steroidobacteraceae bacterium]|jgi:ATP diphosphatase|nr:nucleoside triphosphate pyrophosphohydrolase [Steroidobacteraceae bacterium]
MSDAESAISALIALMARLRDPQRGCPWDQKQTFATVAPYTIEEAYEVADAIEKGDPTQLRDELGDLLFQVVFHAQMAQERGWFDFAQVASSIHEKLVRRHPHVFGEQRVGGDAELSRNWEEQKARERAAAGAARGSAGVSALADVPRGLPALVRAAKLGKRAGRVGFDWADAAQVREKVLEELGEVDGAIADSAGVARAGGGGDAGAAGFASAAGGGSAGASASPAVVEEMGDLLFALSNWSRHLKFDAEEALRAANSKFERRFRDMEALAVTRGLTLENLSPQQWESLWEESKTRERRGPGAAQ